MNKVIVEYQGNKRSIDLEKCTPLGVQIRNYSAGINIDEVYISPSGRIIVEIYSMWERDGYTTGTIYNVADGDYLATIAARSGNKVLIDMIGELE